MGPVAGGGGEEEAENLSTIDMLHDVVDSFAKQFSDARGSQTRQESDRRLCQRESADGSQKRDCRGLVVG